MAINHLLSDMLTRIRNGQMASLATVTCPYSKFLENCLSVLCEEGYIRAFEKKDNGDKKPFLEIKLKYFDGKPVIEKVKVLSKPGRREYSSIKDLKKCNNGLGIVVLSTPSGVMSDHEARIQNVGGELLFMVF